MKNRNWEKLDAQGKLLLVRNVYHQVNLFWERIDFITQAEPRTDEDLLDLAMDMENIVADFISWAEGQIWHYVISNQELDIEGSILYVADTEELFEITWSELTVKLLEDEYKVSLDSKAKTILLSLVRLVISSFDTIQGKIDKVYAPLAEKTFDYYIEHTTLDGLSVYSQ